MTGFGPFPGVLANPTETLVRGLAGRSAGDFGARELRAIVLPAEYRRSWAVLRRLYARYAPDIVVHFGLSGRATAITLERVGRLACAPDHPDAAGFAPRLGRARRAGPTSLLATLPIDSIGAALTRKGFPVELSDDAGAYVCNATLYRSLHAAPPARRVGFVHVPPEAKSGLTAERLVDAAMIILKSAAEAWLREA
jgi:pyroglutamyl-peptidase